MSEIWKTIEEFPNYRVSNTGRVIRSAFVQTYSNGAVHNMPEHELSLSDTSHGYYVVSLSSNGINKVKTVHRLVASAFVDNPEGLDVVNHIDGNKHNNSASNLEWCTLQYNNQHALTHDLNKHTEVIATDIDTNDSVEFFSLVECAKALSGSPSDAHQALRLGSVYHGHKLSYKDRSKQQELKMIQSQVQPIGGNTPYPVRCIETGEEFPSARKAAEHFPVCDDTIRNALRYSGGYVKKLKLHFELVQ